MIRTMSMKKYLSNDSLLPKVIRYVPILYTQLHTLVFMCSRCKINLNDLSKKVLKTTLRIIQQKINKVIN